MNNESIDERLYTLEKKLMLSQTSLTNKLKEHLNISTIMKVITFNPQHYAELLSFELEDI